MEALSPQRAVQGENGAVQYVLLRAPWAVLCYYAEDLRLKLPLQVPGCARGGGEGVLRKRRSLMIAPSYHGQYQHPWRLPLGVREGPSHPHHCAPRSLGGQRGSRYRARGVGNVHRSQGSELATWTPPGPDPRAPHHHQKPPTGGQPQPGGHGVRGSTFQVTSR